MFGQLTTGFVSKPQEDIRGDINQRLTTAYGASIDLSDDSKLGSFVAIISEALATQWELAEALNANLDPDSSFGAFLVSLAGITGTVPRQPLPSTVTMTLTGTIGTIVGATSTAGVTSTGVQFALDSDSPAFAALTAWAASTAYSIDDRVSNGGNSYICTVDGTSAGTGGPTSEDAAIVDGGATWRFLGNGTSAADAPASATENGPLIAVSGDVNEIVTPVAGWSSAINLLDADLGQLTDTDEELRVRREEELATPGTSPADAVRSDLLALSGVTSVTMFVNDTNITDADGVPPHHFEALVTGGDDQEIIQRIWDSKAAGDGTFGTTSGFAVDTSGATQAISFSRPTEIEVYVAVSVVKDPLTYPGDGDDQISAAIVAFGDSQLTGKDVVAFSVGCQALIAGVLDVPTRDIGTAPSPTSEATIVIGSRERAVFDTSRITVDSSADGIP